MNNTTTQNEWDQREIGVLWKRSKKNSEEKYLFGTLKLKNAGVDKEIPVVCFTNKSKQNDNQPDLRVYVSNTSAKNNNQKVNKTSKEEENELI